MDNLLYPAPIQRPTITRIEGYPPISFLKSFKGSEGRKQIITGLLMDNYDNYAPFWNLCQNSCINIACDLHRSEYDDEDTYEHFNIKIYNYTTKQTSATYHCYVNNYKICSITTISYL